VVAGAAAAAAADVALDPVHRHVPLCPLHAATGLWCPLCGALRAGEELAHGRLTAAMHDNALLLPAMIVAAVWWLDGVGRARHGLSRRRVHRVAVAVAVAVAAAFTVLRNLPLGYGLRG
jgi:hypothetical protein